MKTYKLFFFLVVLFFQNNANSAIFNSTYEHPLSEFDSPNDGLMISEFMAVTKLLSNIAKDDFLQNGLTNTTLQKMLVNTYPYSHHVTERRTIQCESTPENICINTSISVNLDERDFKDFVRKSVGMVTQNANLLLDVYHKIMNDSPDYTATNSLYIRALLSGSEKILALNEGLATQSVMIEHSANKNNKQSTTAEDSAEQAKELAVNILKVFQKQIDSSTFETSSKITGSYFKIDIKFDFTPSPSVESLLYDRLLTDSKAFRAFNTNGCGPVFSNVFLEMKLTPSSFIHSDKNDPVFTDLYYYRNESKSSIATYQFPTAKDVAVVVRNTPGLTYVGLCDTAFKPNLSDTKTNDQFPWSKDGKKLTCDHDLDCIIRGALWLLNEASIDLYVNEIKICDLVKISDWYQKDRPIDKITESLNPLGTVRNEIRIPSIFIRDNHCSYFDKGTPPESMELSVKFTIPNKHLF